MTLDSTISKLTNKETPKFMHFMERTLGSWPDFKELWRWREQGLPESGGEQAVVAMAGEDVVGCVGIVPLTVNINGQLTEACWQQDSLVSPSMRGRRLGEKLVLEAEKNYHLIMAKGTSNPMYGLRRKLGYLDVPYADYLLAVHHPAFEAGGKTKKAIASMLSLWQKVLRPPQKKKLLPIVMISRFDEGYDDLAEGLARESGVRPLKKKAYLNWRYFQCPLKTYTVFQAGEDYPRGAIVLGRSNKDPMEGWVVDMLCASDDKICAYSLLTEARRYFTRNKIRHVLAFSTLPSARRWLMRFGFVPTRRFPRFTFKYNSTDPSPDVLQKAHWNFWHGDGDLDLYT